MNEDKMRVFCEGIKDINFLFLSLCVSNDLTFCKYIRENGWFDYENKKYNNFFVRNAVNGYLYKCRKRKSPSLELIKYLIETCGFKLKGGKSLDYYYLIDNCFDLLKYLVGLGHDFMYKGEPRLYYCVKGRLYYELQKEKVKLLVFLNGKLPYRYVQMEILLAIKWAHIFTPAEVFSLLR